MPWTYPDLLRHLDTIQEHRMMYGLERIREGCARLGHPERAVPIVHIAGTNGKGSTVAFLRTLLQGAGYRVGTYTSPHLCDFTERIALDGCPCDGNLLASIAERVLHACADLALTYFECSTLLAFCTFAHLRPDIVLLETGLGGRLDATNVAQPVAIGLTPVAYDHMHLLGGTLESIAREKCGIVKPGVPVVSAPQPAVVTSILQATAQALDAPLSWAVPMPASVPLGLPGAHQRTNAGLAVALAERLHTHGWRRSDPALLRDTAWPGRCEWLRRDPPLLFDAAHNMDGARALADYLASIRNGRQIHCTMGVMAEKAVDDMIAVLRPVVDHFVTVTPPSPRALPAEALAARIVQQGGTAHPDPFPDWPQRCVADAADLLRVVTGSCYLYDPLTSHARIRSTCARVSAGVPSVSTT